MPVHAHDRTERLEPEWMGKALQKLVATIMVNDGLGDDGAKRRHPGRQPRRHPSAMQGKNCGAGASCHSNRRSMFGVCTVSGRSTAVRPLAQRAKRDRVPQGLDGGDAVLPHHSGRPGHHVKGAGLRFEREPLPRVVGGSAESELACGSEGKAEYPAEMWLVAVPTDNDPPPA